MGTLGELVADARRRAAALSADWPRLAAEASRGGRASAGFADALRGPRVAVIAEVKRRSPSAGAINPGLSAPAQASAYAAGGAAAISVLTEAGRFGGSLEDLEEVARTVALPVLRKDFLVKPVQLLEARAAGAAAALLIVRALSPADLTEMAAVARDIALEALFEVRDEAELERALTLDARVIGVNNRNLETLIIDPDTASRVVPLIPPDRIAVAESGVRGRGGVEAAAACGADAVLVGSSLSAADDPARAVRELTGVVRQARGPARAR